MTDWSTLASLATAAGTLVLAVATFSSVRSANRSARVAEQAFRVALRPVLAPSRPDDPSQQIKAGAISVDLMYADHEGGQRSMSRFAIVRAGDDRWWLTMARHHAVA